MQSVKTKKLAIAAIFVAVAVVGSVFIQFPFLGSNCSPTQHMVNVLCAVFLGPAWGVGVAFCASLLRNLLGVGSLMAFPGSMVGALCCGLVYMLLKNKKPVVAITATLVAEMLGTGVLGGLCAYPVATLFMNNVDAATVAVTAYIIPFFISTFVGSLIAGALVFALQAGGALKRMQRTLDPNANNA